VTNSIADVVDDRLAKERAKSTPFGVRRCEEGAADEDVCDEALG
jgi:hypothetical protein